jgi:hypothetical protein
MNARLILSIGLLVLSAYPASAEECYDNILKRNCNNREECDQRHNEYMQCLDNKNNSSLNSVDPNMGPLGGSASGSLYHPPGSLEKIPMDKVK